MTDARLQTSKRETEQQLAAVSARRAEVENKSGNRNLPQQNAITAAENSNIYVDIDNELEYVDYPDNDDNSERKEWNQVCKDFEPKLTWETLTSAAFFFLQSF